MIILELTRRQLPGLGGQSQCLDEVTSEPRRRDIPRRGNSRNNGLKEKEIFLLPANESQKNWAKERQVVLARNRTEKGLLLSVAWGQTFSKFLN